MTRLRTCAFIVLLTSLSVSACAPTADGIVVSREVAVPDFAGGATAIARTSKGDLVVAGTSLTAWAFALSGAGEERWRFSMPMDPTLAPAQQTSFQGVVPLPNGSSLFCGYVNANKMTVGLTMVLNPAGRVVDRRELIPRNDPRYFHSQLFKCLPWNGGAALIGATTDGQHGSGWLVKVDSNGATEWEIVAEQLPNPEAIEIADHSLVLSGMAFQQTRLARITPDGRIAAVAHIDHASFPCFVHTPQPQNGVSLVTYDQEGHALLHSLKETLADAQSPKSIEFIFTHPGYAHQLADGSVALFGQTGSRTAAIARIGTSGKGRALYVFPSHPYSVSPSVSDTLALSANEFITVRDRSTTDLRKPSAIVLSWVTFE